jgi:two-component system OmpR family sensor kinase
MIRHRLLVAIVAGVAVVVAVTGVVVVSILENRLVAVLDEQLTDFAAQRPLHGPTGREQVTHGPAGEAPDVRHLALVEVERDGEVRSPAPAGPTAGAMPDVAGRVTPFGPETVPGVGDGGPGYRALGLAMPDGGVLVAAVPLANVDAAVVEARRILVAAGAVALAIVALMVWYSIRRSLRPIDHMIDAAERIAGGELTARTTVTNPASEVGHLARALNTMLDRLQAAMADRAASEERMRRFVADASHELRTPLTSVRGYAELHRQGARSPEEVERGMRRIEREARHMEALVEDLLLLARLDQGRPVGDEPVDLTAIVRGAVDGARAADRHRSVELRVPEEPATVRGDHHRLRQVLDNLLANVRDHTDPGARATVCLTHADGAVTVTVSDDGPGMSADEAAHAFERFWQAQPTTTRPRPGAGLGLPIVAQLVAAHGGTIALDSSPGGGTSVVVTLPAATRPGGDGGQIRRGVSST